MIGPEHAEEVAFWRGWLHARGGEWTREFEERVDPALPLHWEHAQAIGAPAGSTVEILDVGAGPLTSVGKVWAGRTVKITAVDPLADEYDQLLKECGITPPVRTIRGDAMGLIDQFGRDRFDMVHGRNAIDHTPDAPGAIGQMLGVTRPGGCVYLSHARNEGEKQGYEGMHAWNFDGEDRGHGGVRFVAWNAARRVDVTELMRDKAEVVVKLLPGWINVVIRKLPKWNAGERQAGPLPHEPR